MRPLALMAAVLLSATAFVVPSSSSPAYSSPTTTKTTATAPAPLRNGCSTLHSRKFFERYAGMVYAGTKKLNHHRAVRLVLLERCQHSAKDERWAKRVRHTLSAQNQFRRHAFCGTPTCNRFLGMRMAENMYGPGAGSCIDYIVSRESGWVTRKYNYGGSGAYGVPQALPGSKMASAGPDWETNPATQIRWMLGYVKRYGGICGAAAFWAAHHYY